MPDSTLPDFVHPSRCRLQRLFSPRSVSMYESAPTSGLDELRFPRFKSNQSYKTYKCLSPPVSNLSTLGSLKVYISSFERISSDLMCTEGTAVRCFTRPNLDRDIQRTRTRIKDLCSSSEEQRRGTHFISNVRVRPRLPSTVTILSRSYTITGISTARI